MKIGKRGAFNRRIIEVDHLHEGSRTYEISTHATKGFRTRRLYGPARNAAGSLYRAFIGA